MRGSKGKRAGRGFGRKIPKVYLNIKREDPIDYKDVELMQKCIGSQGQILSRRRTTLNAQRQRELKQAVKRARHVAILPFVG